MKISSFAFAMVCSRVLAGPCPAELLDPDPMIREIARFEMRELGPQTISSVREELKRELGIKLDRLSSLSQIPTTDLRVRILRAKQALLFSPDGSFPSVSDPIQIEAAQIPPALVFEKEHTVRGGGSAVAAVTFSPDGRHLAVGTETAGLQVVEVDSGRPSGKRVAFAQRLRALFFAPDGRALWSFAVHSGYDQGVLQISDPISAQGGRSPFFESMAFRTVGMSRDGRYLVSGGTPRTLVWDLENREVLFSWPAFNRDVYHVAFSEDARFVVATGRQAQLSTPAGGLTLVRVWNIENSLARKRTRFSQMLPWLDRPKKILELGVERAIFDPRGGRIAVVLGRKLRIYPLDGGGPVSSDDFPHAVTSIAYRPDGEQIALGLTDGSIHLLDSDSVTKRAVFSPNSVDGDAILSLAFSPDGKRLACGTRRGDVHLWKKTDASEILPEK